MHNLFYFIAAIATLVFVHILRQCYFKLVDIFKDLCDQVTVDKHDSIFKLIN